MLQMDRQTCHSLGILAWVALGLFLLYLSINLAIWIVINLLPTLFCLAVVIIVVYLMFAKTFQTAKPTTQPPAPVNTIRRNGLSNEQAHPHKGRSASRSKNRGDGPIYQTPLASTHRAPGYPTSRGNWRGY